MNAQAEAYLRKVDADRKLGGLLAGAATVPLLVILNKVGVALLPVQQVSLTVAVVFLTIALMVGSVIVYFSAVQEARVLATARQNSEATLSPDDIDTLDQTRPKVHNMGLPLIILGYVGGYFSLAVFIFASIWQSQ